MKVSIIVPFYKYNQFLEDCLASIADSQLEDFETILVLDRCGENLDGILERYYQSAALKVISMDGARSGVAAARNEGLRAACGEYVYFLDSDDYVMDDCLKLMLEKAEESDADIVCGRKRYSWFKRKVYLGSQEERKEQDDLRERKEKDALHNISVLHMLIRRQMIEERQIRFHEEIKMYADMSFVMQVLQNGTICCEVPKAVYVKRRHNDPIDMPAICDVHVKERLDEMLMAYGLSKSLLKETSGELGKDLDKKFIDTFTGPYLEHLNKSSEKHWKERTILQWADKLALADAAVVKELAGYKKQIVKYAIAKDTGKVIKVAKRQVLIRKIKAMTKNRAEAGKFVYGSLFSRLPIKKNYVVFETFMGKNYSDSPKYIYEYLAKNNRKNFKFIWVLNNGAKPPYGAKVIKRMSLSYLYYLAVSKYFVFNVRQPVWFNKREGQVFLETWHGTPLKRLVFDQEEVTSASPTYKMEFYEQRQEWDYLISANPFSTETFRRCFKYENEMLEVGYPRNDLMYHPDKEMIALELKRKLGIPLNKKTILYAPTWRDDEYYKPFQYKFTLQLDLKKMKEELGEDYVVLLRTHYYISDHLDVTGVEDFAINVSKYDDITEIYLVSDLCITDYSSVFFDYANLKRPVLFYTYDMDKYRDDLRGFYIDMNTEVPGPLLYSTEEVIEAIKNIDEVTKSYETAYDTFYNRFCAVDDGDASKRTVEHVFYGSDKE